MPNQQRDTVLSIYDTVADPSLWPTVLTRVADEINARGCVVFEWQNDEEARILTAPYYSTYYAKEVMDQYLIKCFESESADQDIFEAHSLQSDAIDLIDDSVLAPSLAELKTHKNVEILQKFGLLHRSAGLLSKDNRATSRFSVQFASDRGPMTPEEHAHLSELLPHIAKALDLGRPVQQLVQAHQNMLSAMDRLNIGMCILDRLGRVVHCNDEFHRQEQDYPVFQTKPDGKLHLLRQDDQRLFEALKEDALNHGKFGARPRKEAVHSDADQFLCLEVTPLRSSEALGSADLDGYVLYSTDTSRPVMGNPRPIRQAFGLTDAEYGLVEAIGQGLTNAQIAEQRDRSVATINAQVKSILSKTGCATRTQFVRLMMGFGVDFLAEPAKTPAA